MKRHIRGFTFCILWYLSVLAGFFVLICPILSLAIISPKKYRKWSDRIFGMWEHFPVALMEICMGVRVVLTGDRINPAEGSLFIMNHRTRVDWNFFFSGLFHCCQQFVAHNIKIILKAPLMHFPGAGWVMQTCSFIFLHRNWEKDKPLLNRTLEYLSHSDNMYQILLFPEGTDLTKNNLKKSHEYAEQNNLEKYCNVLHPRTTGFAFLVTKMKEDGQLKAIYDVTVAYPKTMPLNELDLFRGKFPEEVHFHVKRHPSSSLPEEEEGLEIWLKNVWKEKEKRLQEFCMTKSFAGEGGSQEEGFVYSLSNQNIDFGKMTIKNGVICYEDSDAEKKEKSLCSAQESSAQIEPEVGSVGSGVAAEEKSQKTVTESIGAISTAKEKSQKTVTESIGAISTAKENLQSIRQSIRESIEAEFKEKEKSQIESADRISAVKEKLQSIRESFDSDFKDKEKSQSVVESIGRVSILKEKLNNLKESFESDSKSKDKSLSVLGSIRGVLSEKRKSQGTVVESIEAVKTSKETSQGTVTEPAGGVSIAEEKAQGSVTASDKKSPSKSVQSLNLKQMSVMPTEDRFRDYRPSHLLYLVLGFWLTLIVIVGYLVTCSCYLQIWVLTHAVLFIVLSIVSNGFHIVAASYYLYRYKKNPCCKKKCN